jgi:choline dehydrogenase-like flavoprotein
MTEHAVVIAGGGPKGLMLAGELALARVDVAIVERRTSQDLAGSRAAVCTHAPSRFSISVESPIGSSRRDGCLRSRSSPGSLWTSATFPPAHNYVLALRQNHIERYWLGRRSGGADLSRT